MLRNPAAKDNRIAHVVTISFSSRPVERVTRVVSPSRLTVSTFATISSTLRIANRNLLQTGSRATRLSESPSGIAKTISVIRVPARR